MNFAYVYASIVVCIPWQMSGWPAVLHNLIRLWPPDVARPTHNVTLLDDLAAKTATEGVGADIAPRLPGRPLPTPGT